MRHVYEYTFNFRQLSLEEAIPRIHLRRPFQNSSCTRCHSMTGQSWQQIGDHASLVEELRGGSVSCVGDGCHGPAHPLKARYDHGAEGEEVP